MMRTPIGILIAIATMLLIDFYVFIGLKTVSEDASPRSKMIIYSIYWFISIAAIVSFLSFIFFGQDLISRKFKSYFFAILIGLFFAKLIAAIFLFLDDIRRLFQWGATKLLFSNTETAQMSDGTISRSIFLTWLGMAAGSTLFGSLIYGFSNKYNFKTKHVKIPFENLPEAFNGFKVLHFSDVHSGSFNNKKAVMRGVEKILAEKADLIVFSGDLVNDRTQEMEDYMDVFNKVKAPYGVYSTLGNHDYGDYARWPYKGLSKEQNLENLKKVHADLGWKLMMNEHVAIEKDGEKLALLGIENWGAKARFPKYGDLSKAYKGTENYPFKILISHDPSHWDAQVRPEYGDIDLTLSGHTHGMQFGVDIPGFKWSPVQYIYKEWDGLYQEGKQKLYVNPGFGFLGYPGRVGILPEITVIELVKGTT